VTTRKWVRWPEEPDRAGSSFAYTVVGSWGEDDYPVYRCNYCKKFTPVHGGTPCRNLPCQWLAQLEERVW
jgi:hypothetical protein